MKTLKIFRFAALVFTFLCLVLSLVYNYIDAERDWYTILILALFIVLSPFSLIVRMKNETNPANLATTKKGMLIVHNILLILVLGVFVACFFDGSGMSLKTMFLVLGAFFACLYQICGNIIIYKTKQEYKAKN